MQDQTLLPLDRLRMSGIHIYSLNIPHLKLTIAWKDQHGPVLLAKYVKAI
jgi:hypothetical protein